MVSIEDLHSPLCGLWAKVDLGDLGSSLKTRCLQTLVAFSRFGGQLVLCSSCLFCTLRLQKILCAMLVLLTVYPDWQWCDSVQEVF